MNKIQWFIIFLLTLCFPVNIAAQQTCSTTDPCSALSDYTQKVSCYQNLSAACESQRNTLSSQVNYMNSQISITTLRISATETKIKTLLDQITELENEIARLENVLNNRLELLLKRIPESYKRSSTPQFGAILFSKNIFDFVTRIKYVSSVQRGDAESVFKVKSAQNSFHESKNLREEKKSELEAIKADLQKQNAQLKQQKQAKDALLTQTKGQEAVYQMLLAQALAEKRAIDLAIINATQVGPIKRGDPIALVGNTGYPGCSTGAHLHFEVRKNGSWADPSGYLSNKTVEDQQNGGTWNTGSGGWEWPLSDTIQMTQHFGKTPWSWRYAYSGGLHTGYDLLSTSSVVIRAPSDGTLYSSSESCGGSSIIKIKYIDHGDGVLSFYLHVQ